MPVTLNILRRRCYLDERTQKCGLASWVAVKRYVTGSSHMTDIGDIQKEEPWH